MTIVQAVVLGVVQGLTEFLPVSSSGHLIFIPKLLGWADQGLAFDAMVHIGTLLAVVFYFRKRLLALLKGFFSRSFEKKNERRIAWIIAFSIIPAGLFGLFFDDWIETYMRSATILAVNLIVWGVVLGIADWYGRKKASAQTSFEHVSKKQAAGMAVAQALALLPGTSRSGITMTAGLFGKLTKEAAAEFSFLMSVPIIALAGALKFIELLQEGFGELSGAVLLSGMFAAAVSGFFAIALLMQVIKRWSFMPFVVYRIAVGILILLVL